MGDTLNTIPFQVVSSPFGWLNDVKSTIKSQSLLIRARTARTSFSGLHLAVYDPFLGLTQPPPLITFACSRLQLFDHLWLILVGMANLRYATSTLEIKTGFMHEICFNRCRIYPHFFFVKVDDSGKPSIQLALCGLGIFNIPKMFGDISAIFFAGFQRTYPKKCVIGSKFSA